MKYKEFVEDLGGALAGGVDRLGAAIADLPDAVKDTYSQAKASIMKGSNRRKFYDWYNKDWKGTDRYVAKNANNFADSIVAFANTQDISADTLQKIQTKYNADAMVSVSKEGKMLTKNNVIDQLFDDMAKLEALSKVDAPKDAERERNRKEFGKLNPKSKPPVKKKKRKKKKKKFKPSGKVLDQFGKPIK